MGKELDALHRIEDRLVENRNLLAELVALMRVLQKGAIESEKNRLLGGSKIRKGVYDLCDGKHTVLEIARMLHKKQPQISRAISDLCIAGLVRESRRGKEKLYLRIL